MFERVGKRTPIAVRFSTVGEYLEVDYIFVVVVVYVFVVVVYVVVLLNQVGSRVVLTQ